MEITAIMLDSREPDWAQKLTFDKIPTSVTMLEAGDAWIACDDGTMVVVERKTPDDFLGSLANDRIFQQAEKLMDLRKERGWWPYVVITGDLQRGKNGNVITDRGQTNWSYNAAQGAILTIQELGIPVLHCAGDIDYGACLLRLAKRDRRAISIKPMRDIIPMNLFETVLVSLPGIGLERARSILEKTSSPAWALDVLTDPNGPKIPGVSDGTKRNARYALGLEDGNRLAVQAITEKEHA